MATTDRAPGVGAAAGRLATLGRSAMARPHGRTVEEAMADRGTAVEGEGRTLTLTNLDKVLFPATGTTKRDACRYYPKIAPAMLPYLRDRPVTFRRAPEGTGGKTFFQKHRP